MNQLTSMKYIVRIIKIVFWGIAIVLIPLLWFIVNALTFLWNFNTKDCFSIRTEGWMKDLYWHCEGDYELSIDKEKNSKWKREDFLYKNPSDLFFDKKTYKSRQ